MDFKAKYSEYLNITEHLIEEYFEKRDVPQRSVLDSMHYAITAGGKRIRPVLTMAVAELLGARVSDASRIGLAIECIHNYSLIHDDLPCMDNDDLRRGRPTCHIKYGESTALLAGDGLLNSAFEIISEKESIKGILDKNIIEIISFLSTASGVWGMIGGQVIDLEHETRNDVTLEEMIYKHRGKTGALITASAVCGALCANVDRDSKEALAVKKYAEELGLAFQIKDDILDVEGDEKLLGKPIGSDEKSSKATFVTLLGIDGAREYLEKTTANAKDALEMFGEKAWFLRELADFLCGRSY